MLFNQTCRRWGSLAACIGLAAMAACGDDAQKATVALKDGKGVAFGTATLEQEGDAGGVTITLNVTTTSTQATAGQHGVHIHATPKCEAPKFTSAEGHFNPAMAMHGNPAMGHAGDLGNITIAADRSGTLSLTKTGITLTEGAANSVVGLPLIIHAAPDDLTSQPVGNAMGRIACGLITLD